MYIAVIDDDHDDYTFVCESFQKFHSIPVYHFSKGSTFFDSIDYTKTDNLCLIVVDLNLPESSGTEIAKKIKENPFLNSIPVLVLTTGGTPAEIEICKKLGIEIFKKPCTLVEWNSIALVMSSFFDPRLMKAI